MGFFSDIIRDSRKTRSVFSIAEAPMSRTQRPYFPKRSPVADEGKASARLAVENVPMRRLREESAGFSEAARQDQVQAETAARQVVSPSPVQYIPDGELAQVRLDKEGSPNPEAREQTGSESDATVTDASRMTRTESRHGDGSFDVPVVQASAGDSSIRESSSETAMSRAGKTAVETQGRQQAGENRAGLATPPGHETPQNVAEGPRAERPGLSVDQPFLRGLHEPPVATTRENAAVRFKENSARGAPADPQSLRAETSLDQRATHTVDAPQDAPWPVCANKPPADKTPRQQPSWSAPVSQDAFPARGNDRDRSLSARVQRAVEPQVQIGTIEVVVLAQAPTARSSRSEMRVQPDPASRHYLRNF